MSLGVPLSMNRPWRWLPVLPALLAFLPVSAAYAQQDARERERPSVSLRATPPVGFTPLQLRVVAELRDGDDDYPDYYCPTIEWDWGDGTRSENSRDCDPFEDGVSEIERRYTANHTYRTSGAFRVRFRLKQGDDIVANADVRIQVRRGTGF